MFFLTKISLPTFKNYFFNIYDDTVLYFFIKFERRLKYTIID